MELKDIILETINTLESEPILENEQKDSSLPNNSHKSTLDSQSSGESPLTKEKLTQMFEKPFTKNTQETQNHNTPHTNTHSSLDSNPITESKPLKPSMVSVINESNKKQNLNDELSFLKLLQERLLVLFEGLNMPDKDSQKLTMVLNFLQYQLSVIDKRLEILQKNDT